MRTRTMKKGGIRVDMDGLWIWIWIVFHLRRKMSITPLLIATENTLARNQNARSLRKTISSTIRPFMRTAIPKVNKVSTPFSATPNP